MIFIGLDFDFYSAAAVKKQQQHSLIMLETLVIYCVYNIGFLWSVEEISMYTIVVLLYGAKIKVHDDVCFQLEFFDVEWIGS